MRWIILLPALQLLLTSINALTIRVPNKVSVIQETVSVLVPLRNEAHNVFALIESLKNQRSLSNVEYIFLDDNSEDESFELLIQSTSGLANFHVIKGLELPSGWIGKTWALQQLLEASSGEIIVSIDADVRIQSDAISRSITLLNASALDFISPYPRQIAKTLGERLIQPLLQWSWMSTLILTLAERTSFSSMAVANGQFFIVRRRALKAANEFRAVSSAVLDDVYLARQLISTGSRGVVVNGGDIAECRMYSSWREIEAGYGKSLHYAFGSKLATLFVVAFLFITGIAPLVLALMGSIWGWIGFLLSVLSRVVSAIKSRANIFDAIFHPVSMALLIYLIFYSYLMRGEITWKGRQV